MWISCTPGFSLVGPRRFQTTADNVWMQLPFSPLHKSNIFFSTHSTFVMLHPSVKTIFRDTCIVFNILLYPNSEYPSSDDCSGGRLCSLAPGDGRGAPPADRAHRVRRLAGCHLQAEVHWCGLQPVPQRRWGPENTWARGRGCSFFLIYQNWFVVFPPLKGSATF